MERTMAPRIEVPTSMRVEHVCAEPDGHRGSGGEARTTHRCSCGYEWSADG